MRARLAIYSPTGTTFRGILPFTAGSLQFSEEVGGSGSINYEALITDVIAINAWDCMVRVQLESAPGTWVNGPVYAVHQDYGHRAGTKRYEFSGVSLLEAWASETVILPEYVVGSVPRRSGEERGLGWMATAYNPSADPSEPWNLCYDTSRTALPKGFPTGSGAKWISASGATDATEGKFFRATLNVSGTDPKYLKFWLSSDESATLWVAGERIIETSSVEDGKEEFSTAKMILYPGSYAVGVYTATHFTKGGDGMDPILLACAVLDDAGLPSSWVLTSRASQFKATRRDNEPPNDVPPGPTPGQVVRALVIEAQERNASGWDSVSFGFTATTDSNGAPWGKISERLVRNGFDTYWDVLNAFAESDEVDTWLAPDLRLHAAVKQGQSRAITLTETHISRLDVTGKPGLGTWVMALAHDGWLQRGVSGIRREYALELGQALTRNVGIRIADASLRDTWRWDGNADLNPPQSGWRPWLDIKVGDWMALDYQEVTRNVTIQSFSARAGEGGLLFQCELTEYPLSFEAPTTQQVMGGHLDLSRAPIPQLVSAGDIPETEDIR